MSFADVACPKANRSAMAPTIEVQMMKTMMIEQISEHWIHKISQSHSCSLHFGAIVKLYIVEIG